MTRAYFGAVVCICWAILVAWAYLRRECDPWTEALSDPATRRALDDGLGDVAAGRVQPWDARTITLARPVWGYGGRLN